MSGKTIRAFPLGLRTDKIDVHLMFSSYVSKVKDFLGRFENIPDILELDHLTVAGKVTFGRNVTLKVSI